MMSLSSADDSQQSCTQNKQLRIGEDETNPPEWFKKYMEKFKKEIVAEVIEAIKSQQKEDNDSRVIEEQMDQVTLNKVEKLIGKIDSNQFRYPIELLESEFSSLKMVTRDGTQRVIDMLFEKAKKPSQEISFGLTSIFQSFIKSHSQILTQSEMIVSTCSANCPMETPNKIAFVAILFFQELLPISFIKECIEYFFNLLETKEHIICVVALIRLFEFHREYAIFARYWKRLKEITEGKKIAEMIKNIIDEEKIYSDISLVFNASKNVTHSK